MKICIIGYTGCGKSTLARALGKLHEEPVLHLDSVRFLPNWVEREMSEMEKIVVKFLDENDGWVIDGTYKKCALKRRLEEADEIVVMRFNRFACFFRAWKRYLKYKGRTRADMAEGCNEKFDWEFVKWILWEGREKRRREALKKISENYPQKTTVLKNQRQLTAFLKRKTEEKSQISK